MDSNKKEFLARNRDQIILSVASIGVSALATILITYLDPEAKALVLITFFGMTGLILLLALFFNLRIIFDERFDRVKKILIDYFGFAALTNDYYRRKQHFVIEKQHLAEQLVNLALPRIIDEELGDDTPERINLILEAGTTIAAIFPFLTKETMENTGCAEKIHIYTNNLAGVVELHRSVTFQRDPFPESHINLLGGTPLYDYQAVTGDTATEALDQLAGSFEGQKNIGVVTGNWIIGGGGLKTLRIVARGPGHMNVKKKLIEICDYVIVLAPLAKLVRTEHVNFLNEISNYHDPYEEYEIESARKDSVCLLTTMRVEGSTSPLTTSTKTLLSIRNNDGGTNYKVCKCTDYYYIHGNEQEIRETEFPHDYVRENLEDLYLVKA